MASQLIHTRRVTTKTLVISAVVLVAALAIIVPIEAQWLMNMWKGQ